MKPEDIVVEIPKPEETDDKTEKYQWIRCAKKVIGALFETFVLICHYQYLLTVPMADNWILGSMIFTFLHHMGMALKQASAEKDSRRLIPLECGVWISNSVQALALCTGTQSITSSKADERES